mmetsp:Transcript_6645/g.18141  ORF Transcript_6645/g.18141 Transcript_6645/m.18141 type:complete len:131 (-) Transcript_6645:247-639(-)
MGVPSIGQRRHAKALAGKRGRHGKILAKKKLKHEAQLDRRQRRKDKLAAYREGKDLRGRPLEGAEALAAALLAKGEDRAGSRRKATPVRPGEGSGTPGARAAAAKVPKAVRISKRGGRRRKATWHSHGHR